MRSQTEGKYRRVLCVCSAGIARSATAAWLLSQEPYNYNTRAAGIESYALIPVTDTLAFWAEEIICMKDVHAQRLRSHFGVQADFVLDIEDDYDYRQPELIKLIRQRYDSLRWVR